MESGLSFKYPYTDKTKHDARTTTNWVPWQSAENTSSILHVRLAIAEQMAMKTTSLEKTVLPAPPPPGIPTKKMIPTLNHPVSWLDVACAPVYETGEVVTLFDSDTFSLVNIREGRTA